MSGLLFLGGGVKVMKCSKFNSYIPKTFNLKTFPNNYVCGHILYTPQRIAVREKKKEKLL
jgi:hypothetical protein